MKAKPPKQRSRMALRSGSVTPVELSRSMQQMMRILRDFYVSLGASQKQLAEAFRTVSRGAGRLPYQMAEAVAFEIYYAAAELIDTWYRNAAYVDDVGSPRALKSKGPGSFETLATQFLPNHDPAEVEAYFVDVGLVVRLANGTLKPRRRTAVISRLNAVTLDRIAVLTHGLMATLQWNYGGRGNQQPRLERQVHAVRVPTHLLPEFNAKTKELGALYIGQLENWLSTRMTTDPKVPTSRVGVSMLAYAEDAGGTRTGKRPARRK